jgi:hypothetical protein
VELRGDAILFRQANLDTEVLKAFFLELTLGEGYRLILCNLSNLCFNLFLTLSNLYWLVASRFILVGIRDIFTSRESNRHTYHHPVGKSVRYRSSLRKFPPSVSDIKGLKERMFIHHLTYRRLKQSRNLFQFHTLHFIDEHDEFLDTAKVYVLPEMLGEGTKFFEGSTCLFRRSHHGDYLLSDLLGFCDKENSSQYVNKSLTASAYWYFFFVTFS